GLGERLGVAVGSLLHAELLEPGDGPARVVVELALLLGECLIQRLVDQFEGSAHAHRLAVGLEDFRVAGEDGHTWTYRCLCKVDRRDVFLLEDSKRIWQFSLERAYKL